MSNGQTFNVTLSSGLARYVKAKVASGEYANESEVFADGLRALQAQDRALEHWLKTEVVAANDEATAKPSSLLSGRDIRSSIAARLTTVKPGSKS
jgi:putative addiction module CopG family antidote